MYKWKNNRAVNILFVCYGSVLFLLVKSFQLAVLVKILKEHFYKKILSLSMAVLTAKHTLLALLIQRRTASRSTFSTGIRRTLSKILWVQDLSDQYRRELRAWNYSSRRLQISRKFNSSEHIFFNCLCSNQRFNSDQPPFFCNIMINLSSIYFSFLPVGRYLNADLDILALSCCV